MQTLIDILKTETNSLKIQFIEKTRNFAIEYFNKVEERKTWRELDYCLFFGLEPRTVNSGSNLEFKTFPQGFYNTPLSRKYKKMRDEVYIILRMGLDTFVEKKIKLAELHYESSIIKLAQRIEKKDLNVANLKATTSHIGVNINTTLTDGIKTVRAYTIIAQGEIQQPHYRYLIK